MSASIRGLCMLHAFAHHSRLCLSSLPLESKSFLFKKLFDNVVIIRKAGLRWCVETFFFLRNNQVSLEYLEYIFPAYADLLGLFEINFSLIRKCQKKNIYIICLYISNLYV